MQNSSIVTIIDIGFFYFLNEEMLILGELNVR